jgi:hypothetical protein
MEQASIAAAVAQQTPENRRSLSLYNKDGNNSVSFIANQANSSATKNSENAKSNFGFGFGGTNTNGESPSSAASRKKAGAEGTEEEGEDDGNEDEEGEEEEDDNHEEDTAENVTPSKKKKDHKSSHKKKRKSKQKKSFGQSWTGFGKMMTKALNSLNPNKSSTEGDGESGKRSKRNSRNSNSTANNSDQGSGGHGNSHHNHHHNNDNNHNNNSGQQASNSLKDNPHFTHEPTAEEIAAFEAEINKERVFLQTLQSQGMHVIEIEGDGNCLFRALSHQVYLNEEHHEKLRYYCVEHLKKHRKRYEKFMCDVKFEEYIEEMSKNGTWGDDIEIRAMEEILDRHIHIYSSSSTNPKDYLIPVNENPDEVTLMTGVLPITLSYHGQSHYNSIYLDRAPLPVAIRQTKVLLNARVALNEGKPMPMPTPVNSPNGNQAGMSNKGGFQAPMQQRLVGSSNPTSSTSSPVPSQQQQQYVPNYTKPPSNVQSPVRNQPPPHPPVQQYQQQPQQHQQQFQNSICEPTETIFRFLTKRSLQ